MKGLSAGKFVGGISIMREKKLECIIGNTRNVTDLVSIVTDGRHKHCRLGNGSIGPALHVQT